MLQKVQEHEKRIKTAKVLLIIVGGLNVLVMMLQKLPRLDLFTFFIQTTLGILLYRGNGWVRYYFVFTSFCGFLFLFTLYEKNMYSVTLLVITQTICLLSFLILLFSKSVKYYFDIK